MSTADLSTSALLEAHGDWVRRLARSLISDPAGAEDIAQDTWEATLRQQPRHGGALRAWLARIASNKARNLARSRARTRAREARLVREAGSTAAPSAEELAATAELQQQLADAVAGLAEPERRVVPRGRRGAGPGAPGGWPGGRKVTDQGLADQSDAHRQVS